MAHLGTPEAVIAAAGAGLPDHYYDVVPQTNAAGFAIFRRYPPGTPPAGVITRSGKPALTCMLKLIVERQSETKDISRVRLLATVHNPYRLRRPVPDYEDPDCPTQESLHAFKKSYRPVDVEIEDSYFYDEVEDKFFGPEGEVTGQQMLAFAFDYHLRTLKWRFRMKWQTIEALRYAAYKLVWGGQETCLLLLEHGYRIKRTDKTYYGLKSPFHQFSFKDFEETFEPSSADFYGLKVPPRRLFSNLCVLMGILYLAFLLSSRSDFLRAIYRSQALTTAFLLFGYLLADQAIPMVLKSLVWGLSRLRFRTLFIFSKVKV